MLEIFDSLPSTPASAKANAALNAFTVAKERGENAHHAMINALTLSHLSSTTSLSRKRTAQAGLFSGSKSARRKSLDTTDLHPIESLANILDVNDRHVELSDIFVNEQEEREVYGGGAHQSTNSIFDPVTPSQRINDTETSMF